MIGSPKGICQERNDSCKLNMCNWTDENNQNSEEEEDDDNA